MVANKTGLYILDPDRKGAAPSKPKDKTTKQKAYARKYMKSAADTNAGCNLRSVNTNRMIDVEQQLLTAQNATMRSYC